MVEAGTVEAGTDEAGMVEAGTVEAGTDEAGMVEAGMVKVDFLRHRVSHRCAEIRELAGVDHRACVPSFDFDLHVGLLFS
jgi:hypothetical protein